jgi:hypothetical protein
MNDPSTLSYTLTYAATPAVALLPFLSQVIAVTALLALAGTTTLLTSAVRAIPRLPGLRRRART